MKDDGNFRSSSITLCGELRTLWTLLNWLLKIVDVRNVNDGGRAGSGRLTLEKGSVSSRYWTRHCKVDELPFNPVVSLKVFVVEASDELDITFEIRTNSFLIEILQMISMTLSRRRMKSYSIHCRSLIKRGQQREIKKNNKSNFSRKENSNVSFGQL